jgi:16S rRNA (guanine527-N7)-methyltransferase
MDQTFASKVVPTSPEKSWRINQLLEAAGSHPLDEDLAQHFSDYLALLVRWNARTNLTAIRDEESILRRHFAESILCARALPAGIKTLLDFGSGAGFPGLPIALCRTEIAVTLSESQHKKAAFLREAVRTTGVTTQVHAGRAELLNSVFDCVTLRAVDHMEKAILSAIRLLGPGGVLAVMTTEEEASAVQASVGGRLPDGSPHPGFVWLPAIPLPAGTRQILLVGKSEA